MNRRKNNLVKIAVLTGIMTLFPYKINFNLISLPINSQDCANNRVYNKDINTNYNALEDSLR